MPLDPLDAPAPAAKNVIPPRPIQDDLRIANERYLRAHPEIKEMLDYFVQRCLLERPDSVLTFAAKVFKDPALQHKVALAKRML